MVNEQYDFSLRRAGRQTYSVDAIFATIDTPNSIVDVIGERGQIALTERHWHMISDMVEERLDQRRIVLHIEPVFKSNYFSQLGLSVKRLQQLGIINHNILLSSNCDQWHGDVISGDVKECILFPDLGDGVGWESLAQRLQQELIQLMVVHEHSALQNIIEKLPTLWKYLRHQSFQYLLMLGTCVGAPTSLTLTGHDEKEMQNTSSQLFVVTEDICTEMMWVDAGAVLYTRKDASTSLEEEYAAVKRHQGNIISRRFRQLFTLMND